eukprot:CAMPEP_0203882598 /NCGR_PEP_ID=MMETSP0359-20131031/26793_1 /ASSEMBLY_ACC=CAM_ASM_000338 /TAXON_ID=268821 /ORGANISM="Scrippsiella Hangoei, Strain SHTV-5" /LENGTH=479 /DNA_ID=CAMNT_0050802661 /DNA_START=12 /DNA_END=1451 /DNA_ORIENTATION=+
MAGRIAVIVRHTASAAAQTCGVRAAFPPCRRPPAWAACATSAQRAVSSAASPVRYDDFLTETSKARQPSPIRALMPIAAMPGMISLGAGNPNPDAFPFESAVFSLKGGGTVTLDPALMCVAMQYGPTSGIPEMMAWARDLQQREHAPPRPSDEWDIAFTTGSQDAISKTCEMLLTRGDSILVEEPCYPGTLAVVKPLGVNIVGLRTDARGLIPEALAEVMGDWERRHGDIRRPRVLYTIPTGHNPSGATISADRRRAIYELAQRFDLLILEDDPYYFLQLDGPDDAPGSVRKPPPSFLSMDVDGRVMRFDSLSKVLSSGFRVGFATGPKPLVQRLVLHMQTAALCTSGMSQACAYALLRQWGQDGWASHVAEVQALYRRRRDHFVACAERHLQGLAEWSVPEAGMFVWMKLLGVADSKALIEGPAREEKVLLVPGQYFSARPTEPSAFVRASFSTASDADVDEALRRLAVLLRKHSGEA